MFRALTIVSLIPLTGCFADYEAECEKSDRVCPTTWVPVRYDDPDGDTFPVRTLVLPARREATEPPLALFQGGPGAAATVLHVLFKWPFFGRGVRENRDIILMDYRGTGESGPDLSCPEIDELFERTYDDPSLSREAIEPLRNEALLACRDRLAEQGVPLDAFTAEELARDFLAVADDLGVERFHTWGVSYGTLVQQHITRLAPDRVASQVFDSAAPPHISVYGEAYRSATLGLEVHFARCADDPRCSERYPDHADELRALVASLDEDPVDVEVPNPYTGDKVTVPLDGRSLMRITLAMLASSQTSRKLPKWVAKAREDQDYSPWVDFGAGLRDGWENPADSVALWTNTTTCAEQRYGPDPYADADPMLVDAFRAILDAREALCDELDVQPIPEGFREPLATDVPTLVFQGGLDITVPPYMAEEAVREMTDAQIVEVPVEGHVVLDKCSFGIMEAFLLDPTATIDADCVDQEVRYP